MFETGYSFVHFLPVSVGCRNGWKLFILQVPNKVESQEVMIDASQEPTSAYFIIIEYLPPFETSSSDR